MAVSSVPAIVRWTSVPVPSESRRVLAFPIPDLARANPSQSDTDTSRSRAITPRGYCGAPARGRPGRHRRRPAAGC